MIQINDLVVIEIPRGCKYHMRQTELAVFHGDFAVHQLPFPCSIIGLASEVDDEMMSKIIDEPDRESYYGIPLYKNYKHPGNWHETLAIPEDSYKSLLETFSLTNPQSDYLFLKRKV